MTGPAGAPDDRGTAAGFETSSGAKGFGVKTDNGSTTIARSGNNDYAGHDGNVYKKTEDGWQKYENGSWNSVDKPAVTDEQKTQAQSKAQSGQQQAQQKRGSAQTTSAPASTTGAARTTAASSSSQNYNQLEQDRQARTNSTERQKSYDNWKNGKKTSSSGSREGGRRR